MPLNQPPINELLEKADSCYTLVVESSKRARELIAGAQPLVDPKDQRKRADDLSIHCHGCLSYSLNHCLHSLSSTAVVSSSSRMLILALALLKSSKTLSSSMFTDRL